MQSDGDGLYRAILEEPTDQVVKLVYADYLDETGQPERAELIRLQIELSELHNYVFGRVCGEIAGPIPDSEVMRHAELRTREDRLLQTWGERWALETVAAHLEPLHRGRLLRWDGLWDMRVGYRQNLTEPAIIGWKWVDGFVAEVELSGDHWVQYAAKMWWHPEWRFGNDDYEGGRVSYQPYNPQASPLRRVVLKTWPRRATGHLVGVGKLRMDYRPLTIEYVGELRG